MKEIQKKGNVAAIISLLIFNIVPGSNGDFDILVKIGI